MDKILLSIMVLSGATWIFLFPPLFAVFYNRIELSEVGQVLSVAMVGNFIIFLICTVALIVS